MASFKFVGQHTNGRDSITMYGVTFGEGPSEVSDRAAIARLRQNIEFEEVGESAGNLEGIIEARRLYRKKFNKAPGPRWDEATIREKLA
jgi:hypothetical protein